MGKCEMWTIAYRKNIGTLLADNNEPFKIIKNTWRYWCADPFLYKYKGQNWLFAELYDRVKRKGVIGCLCLDDENANWHVALETPFHLSYPYIYEENNEIYMIPETYCAGEIAIYKAIEFPYKWQKYSVLKSDIICVDTTMFNWSDKRYYASFEFCENEEYLNIFDENMCLVNKKLCSKKDMRPAGKFFNYNGRLFCPMQDCSKTYGGELIINEVLDLSKDGLTYTKNKIVKPEDIKSDVPYDPCGIHTYNFNEDFEVVDLKGYERDFFAFPMRCINFAIRKLKRR